MHCLHMLKQFSTSLVVSSLPEDRYRSPYFSILQPEGIHPPSKNKKEEIQGKWDLCRVKYLELMTKKQGKNVVLCSVPRQE
jgi:hypothetical protein